MRKSIEILRYWTENWFFWLFFSGRNKLPQWSYNKLSKTEFIIFGDLIKLIGVYVEIEVT